MNYKLILYPTLYVGSIVLVNVLFDILPMIPMLGELVPPASLLAGAIFIMRDYVQRVAGHKVIIFMLIGAILSYLLASPYIAIVSMIAFLVSEFTDYLIFTVTKKPFYQRIIMSSLISTPIDTIVFLGLLKYLTPMSFVLMTCSKLVSAFIIYMYYKRNNYVSS